MPLFFFKAHYKPGQSVTNRQCFTWNFEQETLDPTNVESSCWDGVDAGQAAARGFDRE